MSMKHILPIVLCVLIVLTDGIEALLNPFRRFGVPAHELAMMMTIALRFIPTLLEETFQALTCVGRHLLKCHTLMANNNSFLAATFHINDSTDVNLAVIFLELGAVRQVAAGSGIRLAQFIDGTGKDHFPTLAASAGP